MRTISVGGFTVACAIVALVAGCSDADDAPPVAGSSPASATPSTSDAVTSDIAGQQPPSLPDRIVCGTQYRPDADTMVGAQEPTLTVERSDELLGQTETVEFDNMTLSVTYVGGTDVDGARSVNIAVHDTEEAPIMSTLYQVGDLDLGSIQYSGGHGFTGLNYVYHDGTMLQVWCRASIDD